LISFVNFIDRSRGNSKARKHKTHTYKKTELLNTKQRIAMMIYECEKVTSMVE